MIRGCVFEYTVGIQRIWALWKTEGDIEGRLGTDKPDVSSLALREDDGTRVKRLRRENIGMFIGDGFL